MSDQRQAQIDALITVACRLADHDQAETIALLLGSLVLAAGRSASPAAVIKIVIDSLELARTIAHDHAAANRAGAS